MITTINEFYLFLESKQCQFIKIDSKIFPEIFNEVIQHHTYEHFMRAGALKTTTLQRLAFGFCESDITTLMPNQLHIKWKMDYKNVKYEQLHSKLSKINWAKKIDLTEPIDVIYEKDKFFINDGHHRYYAAKILHNKLNVNLIIKDNPIRKLFPNMDYDFFMKCLWNQIHQTNEFH